LKMEIKIQILSLLCEDGYRRKQTKQEIHPHQMDYVDFLCLVHQQIQDVIYNEGTFASTAQFFAESF